MNRPDDAARQCDHFEADALQDATDRPVMWLARALLIIVLGMTLALGVGLLGWLALHLAHGAAAAINAPMAGRPY